MALIETKLSAIATSADNLSARLAKIEIRTMEHNFLPHEICRIMGNAFAEFDPRGDFGWLLRRVRDIAAMGVRALLRAYPVEDLHVFSQKAWRSMRFLLEEALRRTMMCESVEKRKAYANLALSMSNMERQLLDTNEVEAYGLWVSFTEETLTKMMSGGSFSENPSAHEVLRWPVVSAEFLSLRNFEGEVPQNLLSDEDNDLLMQD